VKQERIALNSPIFSNAVVVFRLIRLAAKERSKWEHVVCQWETLAGIAKYAKRGQMVGNFSSRTSEFGLP